VSVTGHDSLKARRSLDLDGKRYDYFSLEAAAKAAGLGDISRLPSSLKILLENLVRLEKRAYRHGRRHQGGGAGARRQGFPSARSPSARRAS